MADLWGLMAEFADEQALMAAADQARRAGYRRLDAHTPFPVEGLSEALGHPRTQLPLLVFAAGVAGAVGGFFLQYHASAVAYPLNIGGKPLVSWPAFVPVTFELTILFAASAAVAGMLALNGLPQPYHPVFNVPEFDKASRDGFFLTVESADPLFNSTETRRFLAGLGAAKVHDVLP
ncbi:MAG: DUF3341 domain-containing protein [Elusimicrobia bacterium]|nr:DUF3341 domain-containing protein [Elusimicrobiota bacterium]MBP9127510.1 DUF3341 domain-containing protein [Elusimicrobiota bacterium]MBP9698534.1 DUF3341 domain-containing protein [Elusimicrobiota bacterium]